MPFPSFSLLKGSSFLSLLLRCVGNGTKWLAFKFPSHQITASHIWSPSKTTMPSFLCNSVEPPDWVLANELCTSGEERWGRRVPKVGLSHRWVNQRDKLVGRMGKGPLLLRTRASSWWQSLLWSFLERTAVAVVWIMCWTRSLAERVSKG